MEGSLYELLCAKILTEAGWEVEWLGQRREHTSTCSRLEVM